MADLTQTLRAPGPGIRAVVRPPARRRWWEWVDSVATGGLCLVLLAGALFWVWQHVHVMRQGYEIERLREQQAALVQEHKALRLEAGQLRQLRRVEELARIKLGMVTPKPGQVILLSEAPIQ
jgi:cell division protein FtsL